MAYTEDQKKWNADSLTKSIGKNRSISKTEGSVSAARNSNIKRNPDGYIYVIRLVGFDLYKVGVSCNPRKRITDIIAVLPFNIKILICEYFKDVYELEEIIHNNMANLKVTREWFEVKESDVKFLIDTIKETSNAST